MKDNISERYAIANIPRSTTNKAYQSLTQKENDQTLANKISYLRSNSS